MMRAVLQHNFGACMTRHNTNKGGEMNVRIHTATEKPKIDSLCLVFYKDRLFQPTICYYLDDTNITIEQFGNGEGFYESGDEYAHNKVDPNIIHGWVDLNELDEKVQRGE